MMCVCCDIPSHRQSVITLQTAVRYALMKGVSSSKAPTRHMSVFQYLQTHVCLVWQICKRSVVKGVKTESLEEVKEELSGYLMFYFMGSIPLIIQLS